MSFDLVIRSNPVAVIAVEGNGERERGLIACAFVGCITVDSLEHWVWGYGGARNTETFYLYGLDAVLNELFAHSQDDTPSLEIFVFSDGFMTNVLKHTPYWLSRQGRKKDGSIPDAYFEHKRIYELSALSRLRVSRITPKSTFPHHRRAEELVGRLARKAFRDGAFKQTGLLSAGLGIPDC